jgi:hypothetical protein
MIAFVFLLFFGLVAAWLIAPKPSVSAAPVRNEPTSEPANAVFSRV